MGAGFVIAVTAMAQGEESLVYASARGQSVTAEMWESHLRDFPRLDQFRHQSRERVEAMVRDQILGLLVQEIDRRECEDNALLEAPRERAILLRQSLAAIAQSALDHLRSEVEIDPSDLEAQREERMEEFQRPDLIRFRHIFLRTQGLPEEEIQAKREQSQALVDQIREDPSLFQALAQEHSESQGAAPGALLGPVAPDQIHAEISDVLWQMEPDDISDPIETRFGINIFQVVQRIPQSLPPERTLDQLRGQMVEEQVEAFVDALVSDCDDRLGLSLADPNQDLAEESAIVSGTFALSAEELALALDESVADLTPEQIREAQRGIVLRQLAEERGWLEDPDLQSDLESMRDRLCQEAVWERRMENAWPINEDTLREQYESDRASFVLPRRSLVRVLELQPGRHAESGETFAMFDILTQADEIRSRWEAGESFEALARELSTADDASEGGRPQWVSPLSGERNLFRSVSALATGEVTQPIEISQGYMLAEVLAVEENVQLPFEEARGMIEQQERRTRRSEFSRSWIDELRAEVEWSIPEAVFTHHLVSPEVTAQPGSPESL